MKGAQMSWSIPSPMFEGSLLEYIPKFPKLHMVKHATQGHAKDPSKVQKGKMIFYCPWNSSS
jgi:hypothetical protein